MATRTTKKAADEATEVKAAETAETKAAAPKTTAKRTAAKKETTAKAAAAKKEETVKEAAPAKKTTTRKTAASKKAAEPEVSVVFECAGKKIVAKEVLAKAMETFRAAHADVEIKELKLYVNAEDSCAYIVVNGEEYPEDKIEIE